jgi:ABC-type polysaccharide/polyol phosphate transport system ATPase subunit
MDFHPAVIFEHVRQRFRVIRERPDTLREMFSNIYRRSRGSHYYDFEALKDVSFEIFPGEMVGIVGRNGSGKSTLLKIIAGVYTATSGRVVVNGSIAPLIELGAGFHHELTGRENILLNGLLLGLSKQEIVARQAKIIDFAELGEFIDSPVKQYSSGMYMRLAFAVATEVDPDILLIDEILGVGDAAFQQKCVARIEDFKKRNKTIVYVSHSLETVAKLCTRALLLEQGIVLADGKPGYILDRYQKLMLRSETEACPQP